MIERFIPIYSTKLPAKLTENHDKWSLNRTGAQNFFVLANYLDFVYNDFLIHRALVKRLKVSPKELLTVSNTMLSTLLVLTGNRHRLGSYAQDLPSQVSLESMFT